MGVSQPKTKFPQSATGIARCHFTHKPTIPSLSPPLDGGIGKFAPKIGERPVSLRKDFLVRIVFRAA